MTARFGRNKRRAAREAIAAAERGKANAEKATEAVTKLAQQAARDRAKAIADLDYIAGELVRAVGPESAFLPLMRADVYSGRDIRRWPVRLPLPKLVVSDEPPDFSSLDMSYRVVDLVRLVLEVQKDPQRFGVFIRFRDANDIGETSGAALFISRQQFRSRRLIDEELAWLLRAKLPEIAAVLKGEDV